MIAWGAPWAFGLLILVIALPFQARITGRLRLVVPGPNTHTSRLTPRIVFAQAPLILQMIGLTLVILAMARPQVTHRSTFVESDGLDIILAIDTSGSMMAEDLSAGMRSVTRLDVAKAVMAKFIEGRPYDRIGVVAFGAEAFTHVPLTLDHDTLIEVLEQVRIGIAGERNTAIGSAIAVSAKRLKDLTAPSKIVILLTDGRSNAGRLSPIEAAEIAATLGIKVYTIGVGAPRKRTIFGGDGLDVDTLTAVAETTNAAFFRATDTRSLEEVYERIDELEPSPAEVEELVEHEELFRRFLIPGLILLGLQTLLSATVLRRFP